MFLCLALSTFLFTDYSALNNNYTVISTISTNELTTYLLLILIRFALGAAVEGVDTC